MSIDIVGHNKPYRGLEVVNFKFNEHSLMIDAFNVKYSTGDIELFNFLQFKWETEAGIHMGQLGRKLTAKEKTEGDFPETAYLEDFSMGLHLNNEVDLAWKQRLIPWYLDISLGMQARGGLDLNAVHNEAIYDSAQKETYIKYDKYRKQYVEAEEDKELRSTVKRLIVGNYCFAPYIAIHPHLLAHSDGEIDGGLASVIRFGYNLVRKNPFINIEAGLFVASADGKMSFKHSLKHPQLFDKDYYFNEHLTRQDIKKLNDPELLEDWEKYHRDRFGFGIYFEYTYDFKSKKGYEAQHLFKIGMKVLDYK